MLLPAGKGRAQPGATISGRANPTLGPREDRRSYSKYGGRCFVSPADGPTGRGKP